MVFIKHIFLYFISDYYFLDFILVLFFVSNNAPLAQLQNSVRHFV